ncbi:MAG: hypothetical protein QXT76_01685 [Sulfolobales archaeon]
MVTIEVWCSPLGGFPRNRVLRKTLRDYEKGLISYEELEKVLVSSSLVVLGVQISAGMRYVTDGLLDWHDLFRPFVSAWRNVTPTNLLRYFDNNFFYRIPLFTGKPEASSYVWAPRVRRYIAFTEPAEIKVVIPGPVTFAYMSKNSAGISQEELASSIADLLASEVKLAVEAGASMVQIDEPILSDPDISPDAGMLAAELVSRIARSAGSSKTVLALYYGTPQPGVYDKVLESKVTCVSVDIGDSPSSSLKLVKAKGFGSHCAVLGLVNARTIYDDPLDTLVEIATEILRNYDGSEVGITTTTWLDLIPYEYSISKLRNLRILANKLLSKLGYTETSGWGS